MVKKLTTEERLDEHSRKIRMMEDVFIPMAKNINDLVMGTGGKAGFAEDLRNIRSDLDKLLKAYERAEETTQTMRVDGFRRLETLELWKDNLQKQLDDRTGEWRKWVYGLVLFALGFLTRYVP